MTYRMTIAALGLVLAVLPLVAQPRGSAAAPATDADAAARGTAIELPVLRLEYVAPHLVLQGLVPDAAEHAAVLGRAHAIYGKAHVEDRLRHGAVANPAWLSPDFVPDLRRAVRATAVLEDARLRISGVVRTDSAGAELAASVAGYAAHGLEVVTRLDRASTSD